MSDFDEVAKKSINDKFFKLEEKYDRINRDFHILELMRNRIDILEKRYMTMQSQIESLQSEVNILKST